MKNIVNFKPTEFEKVIFETDPNDYIEDIDVYNYFMDLFYDELKIYIKNNYKRRKGKLHNLDQWYPPKGKEISVGEDAGPEAIKVQNYFYNQKIYAKYIVDFDKQRKRFYEYKGKIYTYSVVSLNDETPIVVYEYEIKDIIAHLNIYAFFVNRGFFRQVLDIFMNSFKKLILPHQSPVSALVASSNESRSFSIPEVVFIQPGEFMMGSDTSDDRTKPVHHVKVDAFYMGKYEVTQKEWCALMEDNPSKFAGNEEPVEQVSWHDVQKYLKKLSKITGKRWRLPTEAEWEYACRAGSTTDYCFGDNVSQLDEYAWFDENSKNKTHPVGQKCPNAWGLYDMHGNVWEWCADRYGEKYYINSPTNNPKGPSSGRNRVIRGGGWRFEASALRSEIRIYSNPNTLSSYIGFRCVQEP